MSNTNTNIIMPTRANNINECEAFAEYLATLPDYVIDMMRDEGYVLEPRIDQIRWCSGYSNDPANFGYFIVFGEHYNAVYHFWPNGERLTQFVSGLVCNDTDIDLMQFVFNHNTGELIREINGYRTETRMAFRFPPNPNFPDAPWRR